MGKSQTPWGRAKGQGQTLWKRSLASLSFDHSQANNQGPGGVGGTLDSLPGKGEQPLEFLGLHWSDGSFQTSEPAPCL